MKRDTVTHLRWAARSARDRAERLRSADALATDAENKRLRAAFRDASRLLREAMTYVNVADAVTVLAAALQPRARSKPRRGGA